MKSKRFLISVLCLAVVTTCFAVVTHPDGVLRAINPLFYYVNSAMGANSINVAKLSNTKTISGHTTLTFSGTPTAGQTFGVVLTHSGVSDWTVTIPSCYSLSVAATRTSFVLPVGARAELSFRYDGTTYYLTGEPLPTVTESGIAKIVHISKHTDGLPGDGTSISPLDGSTASKFDAIMTGFYNTGPFNLVINLTNDDFDTTFLGWAMKTGWKLRGEGMWRTSLINSGTDIYIALIRSVAVQDNVEVSGLTVDVNAAGKTNAIAGVQLRGSNCLIRDVRVINAKGTGSECFPLFIWGSGVDIVNSRIENCEVANFIGTNGTMIGISSDGLDDTKTVTDCVVRNNYVHDCAAQAYGGFGSGVDCIFENNRAQNCAVGYFHDTYNSTRVIVRNSSFTEVQFGVVLKTDDDVAQRYTDTTISNVTVKIKDAATTDFLGFWIEGTTGEINGLQIENCTVFYGGTQHGANQWGVFLSNITTNLVAKNNRASAVLRNDFDIRDDGLQLFNNTDLTGGTMYYDKADEVGRLAIANNVTIARASTYYAGNTDVKPTNPTEGDRHLFYDLDGAFAVEEVWLDGSWRELSTVPAW